ncbi:hypothetical protein BDF20DRAFT_805597, partial [Mycotypha africana]|uniref:uncharacterized protein n=1 Tax=Mycotypha africana TaxID=64632 RepID=UPI002301BAFE
EQKSDPQEHEGSELAMHNLFNQLRVMAKKRMLEGIIPQSNSLYIPKSKGLSSVLLNNASKLLCQEKVDWEGMELMKLCLSRNINLM